MHPLSLDVHENAYEGVREDEDGGGSCGEAWFVGIEAVGGRTQSANDQVVHSLR